MKKVNLFLSTILLAAMMQISCKGGGANESPSTKEVSDSDGTNESSSTNEVSDYEEDTYKEVAVGKQLWMNKNLNVNKFSNGDIIPEAKTTEEWIKAAKNKQPAWCYYDNDPANGKKYGKLYNWYAVNDSRGLAPKGWHVPSDEEWKVLSKCDSNPGIMLKSKSGWADGNTRSALDMYGFSALPCGERAIEDGSFYYIGQYGNWWISTEAKTSKAAYYNLGYNESRVYRYTEDKGCGYSVRCLRD